MKYAKKRGIPLDAPWRELTAEQRDWVLEGEPDWVSWRKSWPGTWYGVRRFFDWLETKAYKMHIRVLLSKYRAYTPCDACDGARLKPDALLWRLGTKEDADSVLGTGQALHAARRRNSTTTQLARAARADHARPDAAADRALPRVLRQPAPARRRWTKRPTCCSPRSARGCLPVPRRPRLPHARPPVAHALRRRGAAHQPHHRARHVAGQHAVRAGRALHRPAPARHGPRDRRDAAAARRRQLAGGGRARPADHARRRPHPRHGPGPGRARRRGRVLRHAGSDSSAPRTLTAEYLSGRKRADGGVALDRTAAQTGRASQMLGAQPSTTSRTSTSTIPLERLVCVTGVSRLGQVHAGAGRAATPRCARHKGKPTETPGAHRALRGARADRRTW